MKLWHCVVLKGGEEDGREAHGLAGYGSGGALSACVFRHEESDPRSEELARELLELSASIQNSTEITQHTKDRIDDYLTENSDMEVKFQKHLYIQGAKDCVAVLRELGVIQ